MGIVIRGYTAASLLLTQEPGRWHALVMLDSGVQPTDFVERHAASHEYLTFDDVEAVRTGKQLPTVTLIERGLRFAYGKNPLLVCCRAGRGRSVAMAYVIACQRVQPDEAVRLLDPTRHRPNRKVVEIGAALLGVPGVLEAFDAWRQRNAHVDLAEFYDDMEREFAELERAGAMDRITIHSPG